MCNKHWSCFNVKISGKDISYFELLLRDKFYASNVSLYQEQTYGILDFMCFKHMETGFNVHKISEHKYAVSVDILAGRKLTNNIQT